MLKEILEFLVTGISVVVFYVLYCVFAVICTFLLGIPIGVGIYLVHQLVNILFNGV